MAQNGELTVEAMKQIEQRWATAKDRASVMAIYTDDAMFDNIGTQPVIGKDAIEANYDAMDAEGESEAGAIAMVENREAVVMGNWGYTSGTWKVEKPSGGVDKGTYITVIKLVTAKRRCFGKFSR